MRKLSFNFIHIGSAKARRKINSSDLFVKDLWISVNLNKYDVVVTQSKTRNWFIRYRNIMKKNTFYDIYILFTLAKYDRQSMFIYIQTTYFLY